MNLALKRKVRRRARGRCEYCRMIEAFDALPFHIDHIVAKQHGGKARWNNLALCCAYCNRHKGTNLAGIDARRIVPLFHPRRDRWSDHFKWVGARLVGITAVGRATVAVLRVNDVVNVRARQALMDEGLFD